MIAKTPKIIKRRKLKLAEYASICSEVNISQLTGNIISMNKMLPNQE